MLVRRVVRQWFFDNPSPLVESVSARQNQQKAVIMVRSPGHHTMEYNPTESVQHEMEIWLIYLDLEHTRHDLSTTKTPNTTLNIPHPTMRVTRGNSTRTRRTTGSMEPSTSQGTLHYSQPSNRHTIQAPYGRHGIVEFNGQYQTWILTRNLPKSSL
jgi:hypothetical protein